MKGNYTWSDIINHKWLDDISNGEVFVLMEKKTFADVKDIAQTQILSLSEAQAWSEKSNEKRIAYVVFGKEPNGEWFTYIGQFGKDKNQLYLKPTFIDSINSEPEIYSDVLNFVKEKFFKECSVVVHDESKEETKINERRKKNMNVFVQNLGKYNEGVIQGGWVTLPAQGKSVDDFLKKEVGLNEQYEEYMIADVETNLSCYRFNETENLYDLNLLATYENVAADIEKVNTYCEEFGISEPLEICNVIAQEDDLACQSIPIPERIKEISLSEDEKLGYTLARTQDLENLFEEKGLGDYYMYVDLEAYGRDARINDHYIVKDDYIVSFNSSDVKTDLFSREELIEQLDESVFNGVKRSSNVERKSMKDKDVKTQIYLLETDALNEVLFRQGDAVVAFNTAPDGMFGGTVDLYQSDEDGRTDINSIKTALAEYIGNGSEMNSFGDILNDTLNISSSQATVMSWEEVNHLINENKDFKLTFVTEYEDIEMDNGFHLKNNISHENDAKKQQNKQSMKDKLADAQAKAAEKNHKRDQQEKDKVTPQR